MIKIRKYQKADRKGVMDVCIKTGYMGKDARAHFDDKYLFGLLFCLYYVDYEPENCFVAIDEKEGIVTGYILGTLNSRNQKHVFSRKMIPKILLRIIFYTSWRYRQSFAILRHMRRMEAKNNSAFQEREILKAYPAHLHINVLPQFHRKGIGTRLIKQLESHLSSKNCKGVHLYTSDQNIKALPFYKKSGFILLHSSPSGNAIWPNALKVKSLVFGKQLKPDQEN